MSHCENCGCRTSSGICSNCHEELYIETSQGEHIDFATSDEWQERVKKQQAEVKQRKDAKDAEIAMLQSFLLSELNNRPILSSLEKNNAQALGVIVGFLIGSLCASLFWWGLQHG